MSQNPQKDPPPSCDEKAQHLTVQFMATLKEMVPELRAVAIVFDWKFQSEDLPVGGAYGIPGPLDTDGILRLIQRISLFNMQTLEILRRTQREGIGCIKNDESVATRRAVQPSRSEDDSKESNSSV